MKEVHWYMVSFSDMPCHEVFSHLILLLPCQQIYHPFPHTCKCKKQYTKAKKPKQTYAKWLLSYNNKQRTILGNS